MVEADHRFCGDCWASLRFLGDPACAACGVPLVVGRGPGARCDACVASPPAHDGVRAAVAYGDVARTLALRLKYGGRMGAARTMALLMRRHMPADATLIVPVPLHRWRLWGRGYNQSALIGDALSRMSGVAQEVALLKRVRATRPLRGMSPAQRRRMVARAFALAPARAGRLADAHVVLIDDVHTSGATVGACARALKQGGAARVTVLCWARAMRDRDADDDGLGD